MSGQKFDWAKAKTLAKRSAERWESGVRRSQYGAMANGPKLGGDCPTCGAATKQRHRLKDGEPFFGCTMYPRCKGVWKPKPMPP